MPLTLTCTKCGQQLSIPDELKGKQVQCPKCQETYVVERKKASHPPQSRSVRRPSTSRQVSGHDDGIVSCPQCGSKMRVPSVPGVTKFQCPSCPGIVEVAPGRVDVPTGPVRQSSAIDEDPFADIPSKNGRPTAVVKDSLSAEMSVRPDGRSPVDRPPRRVETIPRSTLIPGLLISATYAVAVLGCLLLAGVAIAGRSEAVQRPEGFNALLILLAGCLIHSVLTLAGGIRMAMNQAGIVVGVLTCVLSLMPSVFLSTLWLGVILYPIAVIGAIWGFIALVLPEKTIKFFPDERRTKGGDESGSVDYLRQAKEELANAPEENTPDSAVKAFGFMIGGLALIGFACFIAFTLYQVFTGQVETNRRVGKGIAGMVACFIMGFGLLSRGLSYYR